jgi:hypothetical protein
MFDLANYENQIYSILGVLTLTLSYFIYRVLRKINCSTIIKIFINIILSCLLSLFVLIFILNGSFWFNNYLCNFNSQLSWKPNITHSVFIIFGKLSFTINMLIFDMFNTLFIN